MRWSRTDFCQLVKLIDKNDLSLTSVFYREWNTVEGGFERITHLTVRRENMATAYCEWA